MTQCYMCDRDAITQEHIPPLCIFPEKKDLPSGIDYRKNLITVPSCPSHNLNKTGDDEYLLFLLVTNWYINDIGLNHWRTKVLRSIKKKPTKLGIYKNLRPVSIRGMNTGCYTINIDRINSEVDMISRGIYYHHHHKPWTIPLQVVIPAAIATGKPYGDWNNYIVQSVSSYITKHLENEVVYGENPDIFYYQYKFNEELPFYVLKMVFYGGIEISTFSDPPITKSLIPSITSNN
jgi:hypothetical protein